MASIEARQRFVYQTVDGGGGGKQPLGRARLAQLFPQAFQPKEITEESEAPAGPPPPAPIGLVPTIQTGETNGESQTTAASPTPVDQSLPETLFGPSATFGLPTFREGNSQNTGQQELENLLSTHPHLRQFRDLLAVTLLVGPDLLNTVTNSIKAQQAQRSRNREVEQREMQTEKNAAVFEDASQALEFFARRLSDPKFLNALNKSSLDAYHKRYEDLPAAVQLTIFQLTAGALKAVPENIAMIEIAMRDAMQKQVNLNLAAQNAEALANYGERVSAKVLALSAAGNERLALTMTLMQDYSRTMLKYDLIQHDANMRNKWLLPAQKFVNILGIIEEGVLSSAANLSERFGDFVEMHPFAGIGFTVGAAEGAIVFWPINSATGEWYALPLTALESFGVGILGASLVEGGVGLVKAGLNKVRIMRLPGGSIGKVGNADPRDPNVVEGTFKEVHDHH